MHQNNKRAVIPCLSQGQHQYLIKRILVKVRCQFLVRKSADTLSYIYEPLNEVSNRFIYLLLGIHKIGYCNVYIRPLIEPVMETPFVYAHVSIDFGGREKYHVNVVTVNDKWNNCDLWNSLWFPSLHCVVTFLCTPKRQQNLEFYNLQVEVSISIHYGCDFLHTGLSMSFRCNPKYVLIVLAIRFESSTRSLGGFALTATGWNHTYSMGFWKHMEEFPTTSLGSGLCFFSFEFLEPIKCYIGEVDY